MESALKMIVDEGVKSLGIRGIYVRIDGVSNKGDNAEFRAWQAPVLEDVRTRLLALPDIGSDALVGGFRALHAKVGVTSRKIQASPEALYRMVRSRGTLPQVNLVVDIYNTISVKYGLALGAHDIAHIDGNVYLRLTTGSEAFTPIGGEPGKVPESGVFSYIDDANEVICYLDVKQVEKTKVVPESTDVFYVVQGNEVSDFALIKDATDELIEKTIRWCGGKAQVLAEVR